jgi:hypothetical protein
VILLGASARSAEAPRRITIANVAPILDR